jgi:GTPase SAR1 family protein
MAAKKTAINVTEVRSGLTEVLTGLTKIYEKVTDDQKKLTVCQGYPEYMGDTPMAFIDRAKAKLDKKAYKVGFAGGFSGGKSTLVNAVLGEPGLLAAEAGECTMSITNIAAPKAGSDEHIEVKYYTREQAIRNIFQNNRYEVLTRSFKEALWKDYNDDKALDAIKEVIRKLGTDPDVENQKKKAELEEFLYFLKEYTSRLGQIHVDKVPNAKAYLTTDKHNKGLGHLLLIEQVYIYKNNPLFAEKGVEIVDLPGTDSTNARQKEITHNYITDADAVILVIEPKGFKMADANISDVLTSHNNEIRNKMFVVMNKFDTLDFGDVTADNMNKLIRGQVFDTMARLGMDPDRLYFTSAKIVELEEKKNRGLTTPQEDTDLVGYKKGLDDKSRNIDAKMNPDIKGKMEIVYRDGGIANFRRRLIEYFEHEIQVERLREVYFDLKRAFNATQKLLVPEKERVSDLMKNLRNEAGKILEFVEKLNQTFEDQLLPIMDKLDKALGMGIENAKNMFKQGITRAIDTYNFQRVKMRLPIPTPQNIKLEAIAECKLQYSLKFAEFMENATVRVVYEKLTKTLSESPIPKVFRSVSKSVNSDYNARYEELLENFQHSMKMVARLRALEETWEIQQSPIHPRGFEPEWTSQVESAFKEDLKNLFLEKFMGYSNKLQNVLWRYFRELMLDLNRLFQKMVEDLNRQMHDRPDMVANLPAHLMADDVEAEKKADYLLVEYFTTWNQVEPKWQPIVNAFEPEGGEQ